MSVTDVPRLIPGRRFLLRIVLLVGVFVASTMLAHAQAPFQSIHYFDGEDPASTSIIQASDGDFYITAARGGDAGVGVIFKMTAAGVVTPLHSFAGGASDGANPYGSLLEADGNFYGTTARGGTANLGTIFRMTPDGSVTVLHSFEGGASDGAHPKAGLIRATDGKFYGTTYGGGAADNGTVFSMTTAGVVALVYVFPLTSYAHPHTALLQAADGLFYGTTTTQSIFRVSGSGGFTGLFVPGQLGDFYSTGPLFQTPDGTLFAKGFERLNVDPTGRRPMVIRIFPASVQVQNGLTRANWWIEQPGAVTALFESSDGAFYGLAASVDGSSHGTLFRIASFPTTYPNPWPGSLTSTTLHTFDAGRPDALIQAADGDFYGTLAPNRSNNMASVFRATAAGLIDELHTFTVAPPEGADPTALVQARDGQFYGTTAAGGGTGNGTLFRLSSGGISTVLHAFEGGSAEGANPNTLLQALDGFLYGTTTSGGTDNKGTVFRASATGDVTVLHAFDGATTGAAPSVLIQMSDGQFYGATRTGGIGGGGTVFRMTATGAVTVLHAFTGGADGAGPELLVPGPDGNVYGTNTITSGCLGRLFKIAPDGTLTVLWTVGLVEQVGRLCAPFSIVAGRDGHVYGVVAVAPSHLVVSKFFTVTVDGMVTIIRESSNTPLPISLLATGVDGNFYGTATFSSGVVRITPTGTPTLLRTFEPDFALNIFLPTRLRTLLQATDGNLYGIARPLLDRFGSLVYASSTVFRLSPPLPPAQLTIAPTGAGQVRLSWAAAAGASRYRITRRSASGAETVLGEVTTTSFLDATVVPGQRYFYTVTTITSYGDSSRSYVVAITPGRAMPGDFDGDGKSDATVFRPSTGIWYLWNSSRGSAFFQWGLEGDIPVPGDYDGDGVSDIAVFRPSTGIWYIRYSSTGSSAFLQWGMNGDVPMPGDYDGDGITDAAVFRPSTSMWYVREAATETTRAVQWGLSGDIPVTGDYDGDGTTDLAVFRPSTGIWYVRQSSTGAGAFYRWGSAGDVPVPGDYNGDGRTDTAVFRPSTGIWYVRDVTETWLFYQWGSSGDVPVTGDFDGDRKTDIAVFRPSTGIWYILNSGNAGSAFQQWGLTDDIPALKQP